MVWVNKNTKYYHRETPSVAAYVKQKGLIRFNAVILAMGWFSNACQKRCRHFRAIFV